jgi:DNA primase
MIPDEIIDRVREATDIVEIIGQSVALKRSGANFKGLCPFHQEKTPSFTVHSGKQIYRCFGCGAGGNVFNFIMQRQGLGFVEAVRQLAERAGIALPEDGQGAAEAQERGRHRERLLDLLDQAAAWYRRQLKEAPEAKEARLYASQRGLGEEAQQAFRLGYAPRDAGTLIRAAATKGWDEALLMEAGLLSKGEDGRVFARFRGRLMFPISSPAGKVVGFGGRLLGPGEPKYLNSPETLVFSKGSLLYALPQARDAVMRRRQAVLVEGYMDALACHQAGLPFAVATLGTALGEAHAKLLKRYADEVVLVYDSDAAGVAAARRGSEVLLAGGLSVKVLSVPGAKDPDEFLKARGRQAFEQALALALSAPAFFVQSSLAQLGGLEKADLHARAGILQGLFPLLALFPTAVEADGHLREAARALGFPAESALADFASYKASPRVRREEAKKKAAEAAPAVQPAPPPGSAAPPLAAAKPQGRARPNALANAEHEILRLLVERPDLVAEARASLEQPGFSDPAREEAAQLLWRHPGQAVMQIQMGQDASEAARALLLDLAMEQPHYQHAEAALPQLLARLQQERLKRRKAEVDQELRQEGEPQAQAERLALARGLALEINKLDRRIKSGQ